MERVSDEELNFWVALGERRAGLTQLSAHTAAASMATELRERRAADLTAEEMETVRAVRAEIDEFGMADDDPWPQSSDLKNGEHRRRSLAVLDKLLASGGGNEAKAKEGDRG